MRPSPGRFHSWALRRYGWPYLLAFLLVSVFYLSRPRTAPAPEASAASLAPDAGLVLVERDGGLFAGDVSRLAQAQVLQAVDGDTLRILWEGKPEFLRYYGVNTPERDHPCYHGATERNRALAGRDVRLAFDERPRDRYGRLLAYVFDGEGRCLDAQLVAEGWGKAWKRDGRFRDEIIELEKKARAGKTGCLWSEEGSKRRARKRKAFTAP